MSRKSTPGFDFGEALLGEGSRGWSSVWCCVEMGRWRAGELRVLVVPWLLEEVLRGDGATFSNLPRIVLTQYHGVGAQVRDRRPYSKLMAFEALRMLHRLGVRCPLFQSGPTATQE